MREKDIEKGKIDQTDRSDLSEERDSTYYFKYCYTRYFHWRSIINTTIVNCQELQKLFFAQNYITSYSHTLYLLHEIALQFRLYEVQLSLFKDAVKLCLKRSYFIIYVCTKTLCKTGFVPFLFYLYDLQLTSNI